MRNKLYWAILVSLLLFGCSKPKPEVVYYPVYQSINCEDAVKPDFSQLDTNSYFASKKNTAILMSNITKLQLYIDRLNYQIECYKSHNKLAEENNKVHEEK